MKTKFKKYSQLNKCSRKIVLCGLAALLLAMTISLFAFSSFELAQATYSTEKNALAQATYSIEKNALAQATYSIEEKALLNNNTLKKITFSKDDADTCISIVASLERSHYLGLKFNDNLSSKILNEYIDILDPAKNLFYKK